MVDLPYLLKLNLFPKKINEIFVYKYNFLCRYPRSTVNQLINTSFAHE